MDLIRKILLTLSDNPAGYAPQPFQIKGHSDEEVGYHCWLLGEAGLINASNITGFGNNAPQAIPHTLTWKGHDFVDNARSQDVWSKTKARISSIGGTVSMDVLISIMKEIVKQQTGLG
jgi:hypothetical protein